MMYKGLKAGESTLNNANPGRAILIDPISTSWIAFFASGVAGGASISIRMSPSKYGPFVQVGTISSSLGVLNIELGQGWFEIAVVGGDGTTNINVSYNV